MPKVSKEHFRYGDRHITTDIMYTSAKGFYIKDPFLAETLKMYGHENHVHGYTSEDALRSNMRLAIKARKEREEQSQRVILIEFQSSGRLYWIPSAGGGHSGSGPKIGEALKPETAGMVLRWESYFVKDWEGQETFYQDEGGNIGYRVNVQNMDKGKIRIPYDERALETLETLATGLDNMCIKMFEFLNTPALLLQAPSGLKQLM